MTPVQQGAFCKACLKNVIDFTCKTENEIYEIVTNAEGEMCGRFTTFQLQQPVRKTEVNNGLFNWRAIAASLAALVALGKSANAQTNEKSIKPIQLSDVNVRLEHQVLGGIGFKEKPASSEPISTGISGFVTDAENQEPVYMANVYLKSSGKGVLTDTLGNFQLIVDPNAHKDDTVIIKYVGYSMREIPVSDFISKGTAGIIEIQISTRVLGGMDVVVVKDTKMGKFRPSYWRNQERKAKKKH